MITSRQQVKLYLWLLLFVCLVSMPAAIGQNNASNDAQSTSKDSANLETNLDELVVVGYGKVSKRDISGSVTSIAAKDFNKGNIVTPENLINGRVAGLSITTGGEPGASSTIRIRGGSSLGGSNDPLIVIDGLPIDNNSIQGSNSVLSTINPDQIESFTVLKDASATAIYGARASNGVIVITTKKGSKKLSINLGAQIGLNTLVKKVDVFSANDFRELVKKHFPSSVSKLGNANTDWQDAIYRTGLVSNITLSAQGSLFNKLPISFSYGRNTQEGLRLTSSYERNSFGLTLTPSFFNNHLKIELNANASVESNRFAENVEGTAISFDPTQPIYDTAKSPLFGGYFQYTNPDKDPLLSRNDLVSQAPTNPVASLLQRKDISTVQRYYGNLKIDYKLHFFPDISLSVNLGYDGQSSSGSIDRSPLAPYPQANGYIIGSASKYNARKHNYLVEGYARYDHTFARKLSLDFTLGTSYQQFDRRNYVSGELLDNTESSVPVTTIYPDLKLMGIFARANISWDKRYLLTLSYRRDGSSRFSPENRWGNFPAIAFAWQIKETLLPSSKAVSTLKFRTSFGVTGQQDIGIDQLALYLERYALGIPSSQYLGTSVAYPEYINQAIKWEETSTFNVGVDYGFIGNRLTGSVEYFYKESRDLLSKSPVADGSSFSNVGYQNIGSFTSSGVEFSIAADVIRNKTPKGFSWLLSYNATFIQTDIKTLAQGLDQLVGNVAGGTGNTIQIHRVGNTPYSFYVYKQVYDANGKPIEGARADFNGDGQINENDKYIFHNPAPTVYMGFQSSMNYQNFYLNLNFRANLGNYVYNNVNSARAQYNLIQNINVLSNLPTSVLNSDFNNTSNVILSDYYVENASFLRLDNATLGHNFSIAKNKLDFNVYFSVQNVFVITNYSGIDPEISSGIDNTIFPRARTFMIGFNCKF